MSIRKLVFKSQALKDRFSDIVPESLIIVDEAITTRNRFHHFVTSLCHLSDGKIYCYGQIIGSAADIEIGEKVDL